MDAIFLAFLAVWFSGRALYLTYQKRQIQQGLVANTCEIIVLRETLDYARDELAKVDPAYVANLEEFYEKTHQLRLDELGADLQRQPDEKEQR